MLKDGQYYWNVYLVLMELIKFVAGDGIPSSVFNIKYHNGRKTYKKKYCTLCTVCIFNLQSQQSSCCRSFTAYEASLCQEFVVNIAPAVHKKSLKC
jgi:hypothetical protein